MIEAESERLALAIDALAWIADDDVLTADERRSIAQRTLAMIRE